MNKRRLFDHWLDVVFFILIIVGTMSAVSYISSEQIFDAKIVYVNNLKAPYSIQLEIDSKINQELKYDVEIIYKKEDLVVGDDKIKCYGSCELKIDLKKAFFDTHEVFITTKYQGVNYQKKLKFNLEKLESQNQVQIKNDYFYDNNSNSVLIDGKFNVISNSTVFYEIFPVNDDTDRQKYSIDCNLSCDFNINLTSDIIIGEYRFDVYFEDDVISKIFEIKANNIFNVNDSFNSNLNLNNSSQNRVNISKEDLSYKLLNYKTNLSNFTLYLDSKKNTFNLANLFYNDLGDKNNNQLIAFGGNKANFYAYFNSSEYTILDFKGVQIEINDLDINVYDKSGSSEDDKYVIITKKEYLNFDINNKDNITFEDLLNNYLQDSIIVYFISDYIEDSIELNQVPLNLRNKIIRDEGKNYYKTNLPKKFDKESFAFDVETNGLDLDKISKQDAMIIDKIDYLPSKEKEMNIYRSIKETKTKIDGKLKHSEIELDFKGLNLDESGIDLDIKKLNKRFEFETKNNQKVILNDIIAIDPSRLEFDSAKLKKIAKGTSLYKCREWDYEKEICYGTWEKIQSLTPGQEYNIQIEPYDPAFSEAGIIFQDNFEIGGAYWLGFWQNIVESDSELTTSWGIDSQYKYAGSYSLTESPGRAYDPAVSSGGYQPHTSVVTPPINLSGLISANATYYHRIYLEPDTGTSCWDAVLTKISTDGIIWNYVDVIGYTERTISSNSQPEEVTGDWHAICGQYTTWTQVAIDLTPYVGQETVYLKWSFTADDNTGFDGYNFDNFVVYGKENQNPVIDISPSFNPHNILVGQDSILNLSVDDDSSVNVIGTLSFANSTIQNYSLPLYEYSKSLVDDVEDSIISETGANITIFSDTFLDARYWTRDIGSANDWDIDTSRLHVDQVSPFPQYVTLNPQIDLRNYSGGEITFQYSETGTLEANDCLYQSLNDGTGWNGDNQIFCDDLGGTMNGKIGLSSNYFVKNFQFRFGASRVDQAAEDVYIDNFFIYVWHKESKTTGKLYHFIDENFTSIDYINVTITVDSYNPTASVANSNNDPDLYVALSDGTGDDRLKYIGKFNLSSVYTGTGLDNTDRTFSYIIDTNSVLNYWINNPSSRYLRIGAFDLDYRNAASKDEIKFKDVKVQIKGIGSSNIYYYNFSNFLTPGVHNLTDIYITDYFGQSIHQTYSDVNFTVKRFVSIDDGYLSNNNIFIGNDTTMFCKVVDNATKEGIKDYIVSFYANSTYLGSNQSALDGWSKFTFTDSSVSESMYNVTCNITSNVSQYAFSTNQNSSIQQLNVWGLNADITKPNLKDFWGSPSLSNVGLGFNNRVYVSDNVKVKQTDFCVKVPGSYSYSCYKMQKPASLNGTGNYTYTYTGDNLEGKYYYYFKAYDNWTISNWDISPIFSFDREISDAIISIKNKNKLYKKIQDVEILDYSYHSIINNSLGVVSGYIGPYVVFNNSFSDEFNSWTKINNPSGTALYSGDGGTFSGVNYENLDTDTTAVSSRTPGTDNSAARFSMEGGTYTLGGSTYSYFERNLDLQGYDDADISFYYADNGVPTMVSGGYPLSLEVYDGTWYQANTIQGTGGTDATITNTDYHNINVDFSGYNLVDNFKIRFSGGGVGATTDHFVIDDVVVTGTATEVISKRQNYTFGNTNLNLSHFSVTVTINDYDNRGSTTNIEPDLSLEFYDGSDFVSKKYCNLNTLYGFNQSVSSSAKNCTIIISNNDIIKAWENKNNRILRINSENMDVNNIGSDNINWGTVYFNYYTPSLAYNPGDTDFDIYLTNRIYHNVSNELKELVNLTLIKIINKSSYDIGASWNTQNLPLVNLPNGNYYSSSALTDGSGNIIKDSKNNYIVSTDSFEIQNLFINLTSPKRIQYPENTDIWVNVTLDTSYYTSGGWCAYQLNNDSNVSMAQIDATHFSKLIPYYNFTLFDNYIKVFCNDNFGDITVSDVVPFNMTVSLKIAFVPPTDLNGSFVNRSWTYVNVAINDTYPTSVYFNLNNTVLGYWNYENVSSFGYLKEVLGDVNNGVLFNNASSSISGNIRGEYGTFDGDADYVLIDDDLNEIFTGDDFSIGFWLKINDLFVVNNILSKNNMFSVSFDPVNQKLISRINNLFSYSSSNNIITNNDWVYITILYKNNNYIKYYLDGNLFSQVNSVANLIPNSNNFTLGVVSQNNLVDSLNGNLDEIIVYDRILYEPEIKSLYNSKINYFQNNFTKLTNGEYSLQACGIDEWGNYECTETRYVNINITLLSIMINNPINNSKFMPEDNITFNFSTDMGADSTWFVLDNNGTKYFLDSVSILDWLKNYSFETGYHSMVGYANDSIGNKVTSGVYEFRVHPNINLEIEKSIISIDRDKFLIDINLNNKGSWEKISYIDFSYINLDSNLFSLIPGLIENIFNGEIFQWNISLSQGLNKNINYGINGTNYYELRKNYVIGLE